MIQKVVFKQRCTLGKGAIYRPRDEVEGNVRFIKAAMLHGQTSEQFPVCVNIIIELVVTRTWSR